MPRWKVIRALILPFTVLIVVPSLILYNPDAQPDFALSSPFATLTRLLGLGLIALGLTLMYRTISLFWRVGDGTLAPWDATRNLVVEGPYRHVRNPMISGVILVLLGEAAILRSFVLLTWATIFFTVNAIYIPLWEEPGLVHRFGEPYLEFKKNVPRWLPRLRPWRPERD